MLFEALELVFSLQADLSAIKVVLEVALALVATSEVTRAAISKDSLLTLKSFSRSIIGDATMDFAFARDSLLAEEAMALARTAVALGPVRVVVALMVRTAVRVEALAFVIFMGDAKSVVSTASSGMAFETLDQLLDAFAEEGAVEEVPLDLLVASSLAKQFSGLPE